MSATIHFTAEQVAAGEHESLSPDRFDFRWNADHTEVAAVPLAWWDDASYARYQSGAFEDE